MRFPFTVEPIGERFVVRDDLVPGGTKRRILDKMIAAIPEPELVYASPAYGYAQIALAHSCAAAGKRSAVFVAQRAKPHPRTLQAKAAGARVFQVEHGYLTNVQAKAKAYADRAGAAFLPFGLDTDQFRNALAQLVRESLASFPANISEVWTAAGSGTLSRALQSVWPDLPFVAVQVGKAPSVGRARLIKAPEKFEIDAKEPPPFPSCSNYDAKVWQFFRREAPAGALYWNVGA